MGVVHPGHRNPNWKGGRTLASNGYILVKQPDHPSADVRGYVYEHRLVAGEMIGRPLHSREQVHHINGITTDNRRENLRVLPSLAHHKVEHRKPGSKLRLPGEINPLMLCECGCGALFDKYDSSGRPRRFMSGHNSQRIA